MLVCWAWLRGVANGSVAAFQFGIFFKNSELFRSSRNVVLYIV